MRNNLFDLYRFPVGLAALSSPEGLHPQPGYFRFGPEAICYGQSAFTSPAKLNGAGLPDLARYVSLRGSTLRLPFDASRIIDNLRFERYPANGHGGTSAVLSSELARRVYYNLRPMLGDSLWKGLQRWFL